MADAISRMTSGRKIGVFCMQHGPGHGERLRRRGAGVRRIDPDPGDAAAAIRAAWPTSAPNYNAIAPDARHHQIGRAGRLAGRSRQRDAPRLLASAQRPRRSGAGRSSERSVERGTAGAARLRADCGDPLRPGSGRRCARRRGCWPKAEAAGHLCRPGRALGARLERSCAQLAELLGAPVATSLDGKSAFPEDHPLALGSGGLAVPKTVRHFLDQADVIFGIGCSFTESNFAVRDAEGQEDHPRDARSRSSEQGYRRDPGARRRCRR